MGRGFQRFFAKLWTYFDAMMSAEKGWGRWQKRFANHPGWIRVEMLDKAAAKRLMRARKRLANGI